MQVQIDGKCDDFAVMRGKRVGSCRLYISQAQEQANNCRARAAAERKKAANMRIEAGDVQIEAAEE